jgi:hypothetical protein
VIAYHLSPSIHQKLGEVPRDLFGDIGLCMIERTVTSEIFVDVVSVRPIDFNLLEDGELGSVLASDKLIDFLRSAGLLSFKLVAGEGQDLETIRSKLFVHLN